MKENKVLKIVSYISLPVFIGIIIISLVYSLAKDSYYKELDTYFETVNFEMDYMQLLSQLAKKTIYIENSNNKIIEIYDKEGKGKNRLYYINISEYNSKIQLKDNYILIKYKDKILTNVNDYTLNIEQIKEYIEKQEGEKVYIINGKLKSTSLKGNAIDYRNNFNFEYFYTKEAEKIGEIQEIINVTANYEDFEIYSTYKKEFILRDYDKFVIQCINEISKREDMLYIAIPICGVLTVVIIIYLIMSIGHTKRKKGIELNDIDKIPLEILGAIIGIGIITINMLIIEIGPSIIDEYYKMVTSWLITGYFVMYSLVAVFITTIIKRIKARKLIETSIIWKIVKYLKKIIAKIKEIISICISSIKTTWRIMLYIILYIIINLINFILFGRELGIIIDIIITLYAIYQIIKRINCFEKIEKQIENIYNGKSRKKLELEEFTKEFKKMVNYINDISNGFENAIQEGIKSERLKTELITNVSHDIKTPLTSIINYVDLLKKENINNEKAKEYIEILENKSYRLKKLTEDLVEASKVSSGNVKLKLEKINIIELINQTTGEFEDRFKEKELEIIVKIPEDNINIYADSRYMYRIIENLFSNISKYAANYSRVYIDVLEIGDVVKIYIKNISSEKLNISTEELMQRFVRGDKSRTTEGSGLGLSISKSLTEIQKGKFEIQIDGDLFKVQLEFKKC